MTVQIGKEASLPIEGFAGTLFIRVRIVDTKQAYGQARCLVAPVSGTGQIWIASSRLKEIK